MSKESKIKGLFAAAFVILLAANFIVNSGWSQFGKTEAGYTEAMRGREAMLDLNGTVSKLLDIRGRYSDMNLYVYDDGYIVKTYDYTDCEYELAQIKDFYEFLTEHGIKFLYVNEPNKYLDDSIISDAFGIDSYNNRNGDRLMAMLREEGIPCIDLRENVVSEGLDIYSMFYKTDHHWTTRSGLWASRHMAEALNTYCDYTFDLSLLDEDRFTYREWKNAWLGEQGNKLGRTYGTMDDYTEIKPAYPTSFIFEPGKEKETEGSWDHFVNEKYYEQTGDVYKQVSWHYSYTPYNAVNNNVENGKLLMLDDSYSTVVEPFIALGVHQVDSLILRKTGDHFDLRKMILENGYDTVMINYAQLMIGAHDDPTNSNRNMYELGMENDK